MNLEDFKNYIGNRPFINEVYEDEVLEKTLTFSEDIINIFYDLDEVIKNKDEYKIVVYEEAIYLLQNDPTSEYLTKYEGLKQFSVARTITATVAETYLSYLSRLVKKMLEKYGYTPIISDSEKITYNYTTF